MRKLRGGFKHQQRRLKDLERNLVSSEARAETMADYLEAIKWKVRQITAAPDRETLGEQLPVSTCLLTEQELVVAARKLKR